MNTLEGSKKEILEKAVAGIAIIYPLTAVPQITKIWVEKNVAGVSLLTWTLFLVLTIPLIFYARMIQEKKLMYMWSAWIFVYVLIISGTILYG
ncbi:hypothetical protein ISS07_02770 [Candidatus Woesearchaeota archaeon]|nr:hypothetical protein [Candidatus Woesearchaeota archaeon]